MVNILTILKNNKMKLIKSIAVCIFILLVQSNLFGQAEVLKINVSGKVLEANGDPIVDSNVYSQVDEVSTTSDSDGNFVIEATVGSTLVISAQGFEDAYTNASNDLNNITMMAADQVNVPFRTLDKDNLPAGVSSVDMSELITKNYITYSLSELEGFVGGYNGNSLWGYSNALVLVDGVPREAGSVLPVEIDQVTFLKGVAAVTLYGSRAANGVIMITTKRGVNDDISIRSRLNTGIFVPRRYPEYLGSAEYMTLFNEARTNDGESPLYSEEDIYYHASGENPYRYPDVDYYSDEYLRNAYGRQDGTVEIFGGDDRTQYYTNIGFFSAGSLLDVGRAQESNRTSRFNVRGNVDMKINDYVSARVNAAAQYYYGKGINSDYWGGAASIRPNRFAPLIPTSFVDPTDAVSQDFINNSENIIDGQYFLGGTQLDPTNPIASAYAGGTSVFNNRQFQFNTEIKADLGNVLEGLSYTTIFGIDYSASYSLSFNHQYATFEPIWNTYSGTAQISQLNKYNEDSRTGEQSSSGRSFRQTMAISGVLNYVNKIGTSHNLSAALVVGGFSQTNSGQYHRTANANIGLLMGYDFRNKYFAEFNGAIIHSAKLPEGNRDAFSPTMTIGWRLSEEDFLSDVSFLNNLRVYASAGILHTDIDIDGYYLYDEKFDQTGGFWFTWKDGLQNQSTDAERYANPNMEFPRRREFSAGLDATFLENKVLFNGNWFLSDQTGLLVQNNVLFPSYYRQFGYPESNFLPFVNYNENRRTGFDFRLNYLETLGALDINVGLTGTYYTTKALKRAEIVEDDYQIRQGTPLDGIWGLESQGFYADQADINNSPEPAFGEVKPGDIKYVDQNQDGIINVQDEILLGKGGWFGAPLTMGLNVTLKWKDFTFFALGVLRTGSVAMKSNDYFWVNGEDKYSAVVRDRWTPETSATATFPRLTVGNGANNFRNSDFWLYSTDRFDLSRVQFTYDIPQSVFASGFVKGMQVYVNGANLLTISKNREILELNIGSAPQTRFFNMGVTALF